MPFIDLISLNVIGELGDNYFKHMLLFYTKQLDRTQVSQLRHVFSNAYVNEYNINLHNILYIFHIK